jgi:FtsP/CotA-like multicopper oxidase with cupredoxin domain
MGTTLALPGHRFTVVALDGNPVPVPTAVDVLRLDVAERADVLVEMNNPGVWVFGSTDDMDRHMGLGIVVEYENQSGEPQWAAPKNARWDYTVFGNSGLAVEPDETIKLKFEKIPGGRGGYNRWTINGKSWPDTNPLFAVQQGKRYRLVMDNHSGDEHPVHTHRPKPISVTCSLYTNSGQTAEIVVLHHWAKKAPRIASRGLRRDARWTRAFQALAH